MEIDAKSTEKRTVRKEPLSLFQRLRARTASNPSSKWCGQVTPTARRRDEAGIDASWVKDTRPRRDGCLPSVGRTVTTTVLLVYKQLPQQPGRSLKRRHDAIQCLRSGVLGSPSLVRCGVLGPSLPFYEQRQRTGSLTTSEAGRAGFWSGGAAPRSLDVLCVLHPPLPGDG